MSDVHFDLLQELIAEQKRTNYLLGALLLPAKLYFRSTDPANFQVLLSGDLLPVRPDVLEERKSYTDLYGR